MNGIEKKTIFHGLELLGVVAASFAIDYMLAEIIPNLPQTGTVIFLTTILGAVAKYLRANPNVNIPDYVNGNPETPPKENVIE